MRLDNERINQRLGEVPTEAPDPPPVPSDFPPTQTQDASPRPRPEASLQSIQEEDEGDEYPFDH